MNARLLVFMGLLFILVNCVNKIPKGAKPTDICIYGATSAGITAAIASAKEGSTVVLIATNKHLGGMSTAGLGSSDIDNHSSFQNSPAIGGLALEFYRRIAKAYNRLPEFEKALSHRTKDPGLWKFESSIAEKVFLDWLEELNISIVYGRLSEKPNTVVKEGRVIKRITLENGHQYEAAIFIDATYEGDLLAKAGISYVIGREAQATYGELKNGIRCNSNYRQFQVKVDPYVEIGNPQSGLIHTIQEDTLNSCGEGDQRIQAFCFRMCLTKEIGNKIPFSKPDHYHRNWYEIYLRYLNSGGKLYVPKAQLPNGKTDLGAWHDLSHNLYGYNHGYPDGNYETRDSIYGYHKNFTAGLFYFLANDSEVPESLRSEWSKWGLAKDEFVDNGGWPRTLYIRDGRRMVSDYVITQKHTDSANLITIQKSVGMAYWPPDVHHVRRVVKDGYAYNEGFVFGGDDWRPFGISYDALIPKNKECSNLITPTCISSSHIGYGAIRLEWTFMVLGQSAGLAATIASKKNITVQEVRYSDLRKSLLNNGQILQLNK
ncbi:MAG: FAD-dependent oxidoreductase [Bacteroidota bacterium]